MCKRKSFPHRIAGYLLWLVGVAALLFALQIAILSFPQIFMDNRAEAGSIRLYYDGARSPELDRLATEIDDRLRGSPLYRQDRSDPVYLFRDQTKYKRLVSLTFQDVIPQGFNLSILGNSYVCLPKVEALGRASGGGPKFSIWEGSAAHVAAHEVAHQYIIDSIGRGQWLELPHWKQEGLPEYMANIGPIREDSTATLASRIGILQDEAAWEATRGWGRQDWDRIHYEAGLLIEYLYNVKGYSLEQIIDPAVTREATYSEMLAWSESKAF